MTTSRLQVIQRGLLASIFAVSAIAYSAASLAAKGDPSGLPKAAPDFHKSGPAPSAASRSSSTPWGGGTEAPTTFRVRTLAPVAPVAPSPPVLTGAASKIDVSRPYTPLSGNIDIAKTLVGQEASTKVVPPHVFRGWLEQAHPQFALNASRIHASAVLDVRGVYDNSGKTLSSLGINFDHIRTGTLRERSLQDVKVMVIDCPGRVPREAFQKIRDWVNAGGYLLSTDWSGDNAIQPIFPGYIEWTKAKNRESMYNSEIVNPDPVLFKHTVSNAKWKMDIECHPVRAMRADVRTLAMSRELAAEDPRSGGALAIVFPFGRGYVMHMVGHFDNNTALPNRIADAAPVIGISLRQALASNFVVAGLSGTKIQR